MQAAIVIGSVLLYVVMTLIVALWVGFLTGIYQAAKQFSYKKRSLQYAKKNGQLEEFLIVSGNPTAVGELYQVVVATTRRAQEIENAKAEGIKLNEQPQENR